jgi:hypothetical protein
VNGHSGRRRDTGAVVGREARRREEAMTTVASVNFQCASAGVRPRGSGHSCHGAVLGRQDAGVATSGRHGRGEVQWGPSSASAGYINLSAAAFIVSADGSYFTFIEKMLMARGRRKLANFC